MDGACPTCGETWDPGRCPKRDKGVVCNRGVRYKSWGDHPWDIDPEPESPPQWALYVVRCFDQLGRDGGGMGGAGQILEGEAQAMLDRHFPTHQHRYLRRLMGEAEAGRSEASYEVACAREEERQKQK